ncbi:MAG: preprotein translocase subunit SecG [Rickettsiales bacterium]|nr:preprotein translocase subunit SecG [Rickettsiales bacterium]
MINALIVFLIFILALVCLLMIVAVLMQRPKQEGLGAAFGGGITDQMWGAQTSNVLQKATVSLAIIFFVITLILSVLVAKKQQHGQVELNVKADQPTSIGPTSTDNEPSLIVPDENPAENETETNPEPAPAPVEEKTDNTAPANDSDTTKENASATDGENPTEEVPGSANESSEDDAKQSP